MECCKTKALSILSKHRFVAKALPIHCRGTSLLLIPHSEIFGAIQQLTKTAGFCQLTTGSEAVLELMKLDIQAALRKSKSDTVSWVPGWE